MNDPKNIQTSDQLAEHVGKRIAEYLDIKPDYKGIIYTKVGPKDYKGLARLISGMIDEINSR